MSTRSFSPKQCEKWIKNKKTNPKTGRAIDPEAPYGLYQKLKKQCEVYEQLASKTRQLKSCRTQNKNMRKKLMSALEKIRLLMGTPMSVDDVKQSIAQSSETLELMRPLMEDEMSLYDPQHVKYAVRVIKFMHAIVDDDDSGLTLEKIKKMANKLIKKLRETMRQIPDSHEEQIKVIMSMVKFLLEYIKKHWHRFEQESILSKKSEDDEMTIVPYKSANASSMGIIQYTNAPLRPSRSSATAKRMIKSATPQKRDNPLFSPDSPRVTPNTNRGGRRVTQSMKTNPLYNALAQSAHLSKKK